MVNELAPSRRAAVDAFLQRSRETMATGGRLIFAVDATASREKTWTLAQELQAQMLAAAAKVGGLQVQLVFFRGNECRSSEWTADAQTLAAKMRAISCMGGVTQWVRVLKHVRQEHRQRPVSAVVMIGDCFEETSAALYDMTTGLPKLFVFQEGDDPAASAAFPELARRTKGIYFKLGPDSARELGELLRGIAVFVAAGPTALADLRTDGARKLLAQLNGPTG